MGDVTINGALAWTLAAIFLIGTGVNALAPEPIRKDYKRWGYPKNFWYVTAVIEFVTALLVAVPGTRLAGAVLGMLVLGAAAVTLLRHAEYKHAVAPVAFLAMATTLAWRLSWE